ncbi:hypothetical protein BASA81_000004 [Batrachochytrium salamandrivorans]|nr:hypothetical protein BASA81_000004 [Batrachochytrium salamandrivorans]
MSTTPVVAPNVAVAAPVTLEQRLLECVTLVKRASNTHDDSLLLRALRKTTLIRKNPAFTPDELVKAYSRYLPKRTPTLDAIHSLFASSSSSREMDVVVEDATPQVQEASLDVELYLHHTALHFAKTRKTCSPQVLEQSARAMMDKVASLPALSTMQVLRARAIHTFALVVESAQHSHKEEQGSGELLAYVLHTHRNACLTGDVAIQAVTFNLVLRQLILANQVSEAEKFASKAKFPLDQVGNNSQIRYLYYMGRIQALQLEYSASLASLLHAIRKLPANSQAFRGLKLRLYTLATVVTLLTGELPERAWFSQGDFQDQLLPYFDLVKAVREGNLQTFQTVQVAHEVRFKQDQVWTLIQRLHSSVIKTGLKRIGVSYSRISFQDVAHKLELGESGEALYLCIKAIRDGVLDASWIDAEDCLCSAEPQDVYSTTTEPSEAFQRRIIYLLQAHNDAVKGLRFPAQKSSNPSGKEGATLEFDEDELEELADSHMDED